MLVSILLLSVLSEALPSCDRIGESKFHLSCSDKDIIGPENNLVFL